MAAANLLPACGGEEEPATTAQGPEGQRVANPGTADPETGAAQKPSQEGDRQEKTPGDGPREDEGKVEREGSAVDRSVSSGADRDRGVGAPPAQPSASQELEAAVQELLHASEGERPGKDRSGLRVPPELLDQGGGNADPLEDLCLDPDECPGVREGPG